MSANPTFQHRHYKEIAALIAEVRQIHGDSLDEFQGALAHLFARDNERFSRARFLAACNGQPINGKDRVS
jgi:hypothetical protein